jgi:hypothetical protein
VIRALSTLFALLLVCLSLAGCRHEESDAEWANKLCMTHGGVRSIARGLEGATVVCKDGEATE